MARILSCLFGHRWSAWVYRCEQGEEWEERYCIVCNKVQQRALG